MSIEALLTDFGQSTPAAAPPVEVDSTAHLDSFEEGYNAGWADATKAQTDEKSRLQSELTESLKDFSFSRAEVQQHVLGELRPLIEGILSATLPEALRPALAPMIVETLKTASEDALGDQLELVVPIGSQEAVMALLDPQEWPDLMVTEDAAQPEGSAAIRCGAATTTVDLNAVQARIQTIVSEFFNGPEQLAGTGTGG